GHARQLECADDIVVYRIERRQFHHGDMFVSGRMVYELRLVLIKNTVQPAPAPDIADAGYYLCFSLSRPKLDVYLIERRFSVIQKDQPLGIECMDLPGKL